jgi:hypothetical protein
MTPVLQCTQCTSFNDSTHGIGFAERVALCRRQASFAVMFVHVNDTTQQTLVPC